MQRRVGSLRVIQGTTDRTSSSLTLRICQNDSSKGFPQDGETGRLYGYPQKQLSSLSTAGIDRCSSAKKWRVHHSTLVN